MRKLFLLALFITSPAFAAGNLLLTSPLVEDGKDLPRSAVNNANGCNGENISPTLDWSGAPEGTQSYALSLYDPDAPNDGFLHWVVFNIPLMPTSIGPDAGRADGTKLPTGANAVANSYGLQGYSGPCPPVGQTHAYEFTIYAMPQTHTFYPLSAIGKPTVQWLHDHALESATLTVKYGR
jgi:Raf kinase inhibitor-like YbhB/YbcL family protein